MRAIDLSNGVEREFSLSECGFGYRDSVFKQHSGRFGITSVSLRLDKQGELKTDYGEIERSGLTRGSMSVQQMSDVICRIRNNKLPDPAHLPNAGSFFKNPIVDRATHTRLKNQYPELISYPTDEGMYKLAGGWLIDQLGWKGRSSQGAKVHERQALVLVNEGGGAESIMALAEAIQKDVLEHYGVRIEPEPLWVR